MFTAVHASDHRDRDDLLTAGLGLDGLRASSPPAFADPERPTAGELRRRALWSNWRAIADLAPDGGFGDVYGHVGPVPGREFHAYATLPGASQPHRVLLQLPDAFDAARRCLVVSASSGSRGIYGAIAVAGAWGLPRGCAVAYTDKGAGTDYVDLDAGRGIRIDGTSGALDSGLLAFAPDTTTGSGVAVKHAHSRDNPEADWGRHVRQAAEFALQALDEALPHAAPFTFDNTRVIAVGLSNGGGAVLRAAEDDEGWLDAVVAAAPNVFVEGHGSRALYDYITEAALLMPCALIHLDGLPEPPARTQAEAAGQLRCDRLQAVGLVNGLDPAGRARAAFERLRAGGWSEAAIRGGALSTGLDLWRALAATYASAYGRFGVGEHPCGLAFSARQADGTPRAAMPVEQAAWWSDASGIPPGAGVDLVVAGRGACVDEALPGLHRLRALYDGSGEHAQRVRAGIEATRASPPRSGLPVVIVHGRDDGLVPLDFSSAPYVAAARAAGRDVRFRQLRHVQHFDAFLGLPGYGARYLPLLPYLYAALDDVDAYLDGRGPLPPDAVIAARPRGAGFPLRPAHLALPG